MLRDEHTPYINEFANTSFRDFADQDYISARIAYRMEFDQQFRWCALQAIEKYFKAILIYNRRSAKGLGHNLEMALERVTEIPDLGFSLPARDSEELVSFLSRYGTDRYLSHPTHLRDGALLTLDKTIWAIRRYCFFMHQVVERNGTEVPLFELNKKRATDPYYEDQRQKYKIFRGYLEKVIEKRLPSYDALVWKNFYYGRIKKHRIKNFRFRMSSQNPAHSLRPEVFPLLEKLVDFPKSIKAMYRS